jgi:plastocyanin
MSLTATLAGCGDDDDATDVETDAGSGSDSGSGSDDDGGLYGNGEDEGGGSTEAGAITIASFRFADEVTAEPGATVTVTNDDSDSHTVTADEGEFDVAVDGGETAEFTAPAEAGEYAFHCEIHSSMTSTLVVGG